MKFFIVIKLKFNLFNILFLKNDETMDIKN